jgi:hypothetical protein
MSSLSGFTYRIRHAAVCGVLLSLSLSACTPAATSKTSAPGSEMSRAVIDPYLKIQLALFNGNTDELRMHAGNIATAASALGAPAMKIDTAALQLASAGDLADARAKFGTLSEAIDTYMTGFQLRPPEGVHVAICPMVAKPWLQEGSTLANPYYGSAMPTCGSFRN